MYMDILIKLLEVLTPALVAAAVGYLTIRLGIRQLAVSENIAQLQLDAELVIKTRIQWIHDVRDKASLLANAYGRYANERHRLRYKINDPTDTLITDALPDILVKVNSATAEIDLLRNHIMLLVDDNNPIHQKVMHRIIELHELAQKGTKEFDDEKYTELRTQFTYAVKDMINDESSRIQVPTKQSSVPVPRGTASEKTLASPGSPVR
jgi:hypothetical protein